jgi:hypothetical protein
MSATATATPNQAPTLIIPNAFTLTDKLRIQRERIRDRQYTSFAIMTAVVMERQLPTKGISQSRPRWLNAEQEKIFTRDKDNGAMTPFSEWQTVTWVQLTLDWLSHRNGPRIAISRDKNDMLLPAGLPPLPKIPDPLWMPKQKGDIAPRVEQDLGSRACGRIYERHTGKMFLIFQPLTELSVMIGSADPKKGGFGRIKCITDPATRLKPSLLVNPDPMDREGNLEAYFASGAFQAGY